MEDKGGKLKTGFVSRPSGLVDDITPEVVFGGQGYHHTRLSTIIPRYIHMPLDLEMDELQKPRLG